MKIVMLDRSGADFSYEKKAFRHGLLYGAHLILELHGSD